MAIFYFINLSISFSLLPTAKPQAFNCIPFPPAFSNHSPFGQKEVECSVILCLVHFICIPSSSLSLTLYTLLQCQHKANRNSEQKISRDSGGIGANKGKRKQAQYGLCTLQEKLMKSTCIDCKFGLDWLFMSSTSTQDFYFLKRSRYTIILFLHDYKYHTLLGSLNPKITI